MAAEPGTELGRYEIRSKVGAGGCGGSNRKRKPLLRLTTRRSRTFYEIGEGGGVNFMAMEFVDGVTLGEKIHGERTELKKLLNVINGDTNERE